MTKILIVDDSPTNREIIRESLADQGYDFDEAGDGCIAFEKALAGKPDLILMDITMPRMDGVKALAVLKSDMRTVNIPVVMVSASNAETHMAKCFDAGVRDYIVPPFSEIVFRARVKAALRSGHDDPVVGALKKSTNGKLIRGKILGVLGAKGGVGSTSVAISFAAQLRGRGERSVGLLEVARTTSSLATQLGFSATTSFGPLLSNKTKSVSSEAFRKACNGHPAGFDVMFAPSDDGIVRDLPPSFARRLISAASRHWSYTVLDIWSAPSPATRSAVTMCDQLVLVTEPDRASITTTKQWLQRFACWQLRRSDVSIVVVNKRHDQITPPTEELRSELGFPIVATITPDPDSERLNARLDKLSGEFERRHVAKSRG
jgi:CheY-like chemotaxis protein/MinD-like ATPase involved in chromosome partitioning or flagellar assembly